MEMEPFKQWSVSLGFQGPNELSSYINEQNTKGWHLHLMSGIMPRHGGSGYQCVLVFRGNEHSLPPNEEQKQRKDAEAKGNFGFLDNL